VSSFELIPGTAIPIQGQSRPGSPQPEGRGAIELEPERQPPSRIDPDAPQPALAPHELAIVRAALNAYDRRPRLLKTIFDTAAAVTAATTGNCIVPLFVVPAGCEAHLAMVIADLPQSATVNPSAPFANAASWAFLASLPAASTAPVITAPDALRPGMVAFAPTSAGGPILPGQWTFNDTNAPVGFGGDQFFYVLHGGSQAALVSTSLQVQYRVNLFGFEDGQL
jgi:hypothetical protein